MLIISYSDYRCSGEVPVLEPLACAAVMGADVLGRQDAPLGWHHASNLG